MTELQIPTKKDLRKVPMDCKEDGVIVNVETKTWREILKPESLEKFKEENRDDLQIILTYDVKGFLRTEKFYYTEKTPSTTRLGRYLSKYDEIKVGSKVRVDFDDEGRSSIILGK